MKDYKHINTKKRLTIRRQGASSHVGPKIELPHLVDVGEAKIKTYNRRDSQMVTHSSTSRPVQCLCMAERTGCPVFTDLWSYVLDMKFLLYMIPGHLSFSLSLSKHPDITARLSQTSASNETT
jgi:hypothetical protein